MNQNKNPKKKQVLEDQDLYEEIMSEVHRMRSNPKSPDPTGQPLPPDRQPPPASVAKAAPEPPVDEPASKSKKKNKFSSWFQKKKPSRSTPGSAPAQDDPDDIYYGLKLKPIEEYKKEYQESGRAQTPDEPTSSFSYLFDRTEELPDLSKRFEELHKERQERVVQAAHEAGVETDDIFSLCKEKSDLDFDYTEWKRNTQSIPIITEEQLAASPGHTDAPASGPEDTQPLELRGEPTIELEPLGPVKRRPVQPEPLPDAEPPQPVQPVQPVQQQPAAESSLHVSVAPPHSDLERPQTRLPVTVQPPSGSIEAKELEVEQLIQQALNQVKNTSSIFERVARSAQEELHGTAEPEPPAVPAASAGEIAQMAQEISEETRQQAVMNVEMAASNLQPEPPKPVPAVPEPPETVTRPDKPASFYRFHQKPVRTYMLQNVTQIVQDEIKNFTLPPAASIPTSAPDPEPAAPIPAEPSSPPTPPPPSAVEQPVPSQADPTPSATAAGAVKHTLSFPKVIQIPFKPSAPQKEEPSGAKEDGTGSGTAEHPESPGPAGKKMGPRLLKQPTNKFELPPDDPGQPPEKQKKKRKKIVLTGGDEEDNDPADEFQPPAPELEDYTGPDDVNAIALELNASSRELVLRLIVTGLCTAVCVAFGFIFEWILPRTSQSFLGIPYLTLNLVFLLIPSAFCYMPLFSGLKALGKLQANSDSSVAVALSAAVIHAVSLFFSQDALAAGGVHTYSSIAVAALFLNTLGKFSMVQRIRKNFKFVTATENRYSVELMQNQDVALKLARGYISETPHIAYQQPTRFLKGFLKNSYQPDPSENSSQILAPISFVACLVLCIVCSIISSNAILGLTAFAISTAVCVPITNMLSVNLPIARLCRIARQTGAMMVGYKTMDQVAQTNAVMVDSTDLFPKGSVSLSGMQTFHQKNINRALLDASALMSSIGGTLREVFEKVIHERKGKLPIVEDASYVDQKGIVGWVAGKQILLGTRELLLDFKVNPPDLSVERQNTSSTKQVIYLASDRELVAMFILTYSPDHKMATEIQRLETNGIAMMVRTLDPIITPAFLAKLLDLDPKAIRILPEELAHYCDDALNDVAEYSDVSLATRGKAFSMMRMLAACVRQRTNISVALSLQTTSVILGFALVAFLTCFASFSQLSTLAILVYELFWILAILLIPRIHKP